MENKQRTERLTLSIAMSTNQALEAIQHHLRRAGRRKFKSEIIHEAVVQFAQGLGVVQDEGSAGQPIGDAGDAATEAASLE